MRTPGLLPIQGIGPVRRPALRDGNFCKRLERSEHLRFCRRQPDWPRSLPLAPPAPARIELMFTTICFRKLIRAAATGGTPSNQAGEAARSLARDSNEYGARMVRDYPGRFGLFAALPMLEQDASLREIEYGYDALKADGISMMTNYGNKWPGDAVFAPVFEELNRRKAVVFVHPTTPSCCDNLLPGVPASWIEYDFDTMRCVTSLLINGTFTKFPNVRFIFTHSGGTIPVLARRVGDMFPPELAAGAPHGVEAEMKKLYFDMANGANPSSLAALTKLVPTSQLLFGTDFPFVRIAITVDGFKDYKFPENDVEAINRGNALRLFPRLKK
jgi:6-methylsalicylate decarboxylase